MFHFNICFANWAPKQAKMRLQYGFLFLIYTGCTKIVKRLALLHAWLNGISKRPGWERKKRIALHLAFPVFNLSYLIFKFAHPIGQRRLLLSALQIRSESLRQLSLNCIDGGEKLAVVGERVGGLDQLGQGLNALNGSNNIGVHDLTSNETVEKPPLLILLTQRRYKEK